MKNLHTYSQPRPFNNLNIPIAVQSVYLRSYAVSNSFIFKIPRVELTKNNSFINLKDLLINSKKISDLAFTSLFMLPIDNNVAFYDIKKNIKNDDMKFHFVLESLILNKKELIDYQKEVFLIKKLIPNYENSLKIYKKIS